MLWSHAVGSVRDLGFHYSDSLDFSEHIRIQCRQAIMRTYHIFKGLSSKNKAVLLRAYKTYVRPIVESSTTVFNPCWKRDIYCIERVQNNFTRKLMVRTGDFRYERMPNALGRNRCLELPSLASRRKVIDVCMVHKILLNGYNGRKCSMKQLFRVTSSSTRGCASKIALTRPKATLYAKSFTYRAGTAYLKVTKSLPNGLSLNQFKRLVSKKLFQYDASR